MTSTIVTIITGVIAFGLTFALGFVVIPWLRKMSFGQTILDIGPAWHKSKQGTPTMGGVMFFAGIIVASIVGLVSCKLAGIPLESEAASMLPGKDMVLIIASLVFALGCGVVGFADDFIKIKLKRNEGLSAKQKTFGQLIMTLGYTMTLWLSHNTVWVLPFIGKVDFEQNFFTGVVFWLVSIFIIYGCVNSVNLTDGIDGLCTSITTTVAVTFLIASIFTKFVGLEIVSAALLGAMLGFLIWNWNPAKVFMGDTGSLFLGGLVVAFGFAIKCPLLLLPIGIVYVSETMSDIIQIVYFQLTKGKRIFKMAPIHHHFEMVGWKEKKICIIFSIASAMGCAIGLFCIYYGM